MSIFPVSIRFTMSSYDEKVQESRLEILSLEKEWELICNCSLTADSAPMLRVAGGQIIVKMAYKGYLDDEQHTYHVGNQTIRSIGRLSNPRVDEDDPTNYERSLCAFVHLEEAEFLKLVDFVRVYSRATIGMEVGVWSPEFSEFDIMNAKWDGKPILEILTFSYWSGTR